MTALPSDITFGYVTGQYVRAVGGTTSGANDYPFEQPAQGTVTFAPMGPTVLSETPNPATVIVTTEICTLDASGYLIDAAGNRGVWLVAGVQYRVQVSVTGQSFTIAPTSSNTASAPLDLSLAAPLVPNPTTVWVVNQQVYNDTLAADQDAQTQAANAAASATAAANSAAQAAAPTDTQVATLVRSSSASQTALDERYAATHAWTGTANASTSTESVAGVVTRTNLCTNPSPSVGTGWGVNYGTDGTGTATYGAVSGLPSANGATVKWTASPTTGWFVEAATAAVTAGQTITAQMTGIHSWAGGMTQLTLQFLDSNGASLGYFSGPNVTVAANTATTITNTVTAPANAVSASAFWDAQGSGTVYPPVNATAVIGAALVEATNVTRAYFDGDTRTPVMDAQVANLVGQSGSQTQTAMDGRYPKQSLRTTRQTLKQPMTSGLSRRDIGGFDWVFWGTSMTEGGPANGTNEVALGRSGRWLDRIQANLRAKYPLISPVTGGGGYIPAYYETFYVGGTTNNGVVAPSGVTYSANLTQYNSGLGNRSYGLTSTSDWIQFTFTGDSVDIFGANHTTASATASVSVDGGSATTWTTPSTTLTSAKYSVTGLTVGSHTVRITGGSAGTVTVDGIMPYNGDGAKGIRIWDAGKGSAKIGDFGADPHSRVWQPMGLIAPRMLTIEYGYNEYFGNVSPSTFQTNLTNAVSWMLSYCTIKPTVQFIVFPAPGVNGSQGTAAPYQSYVNAIYAAAAATPNSFVTDLSSALQSGAAVGTGGLGTLFDGVHFNAYGQAGAADLILDDALLRMGL